MKHGLKNYSNPFQLKKDFIAELLKTKTENELFSTIYNHFCKQNIYYIIIFKKIRKSKKLTPVVAQHLKNQSYEKFKSHTNIKIHNFELDIENTSIIKNIFINKKPKTISLKTFIKKIYNAHISSHNIDCKSTNEKKIFLCPITLKNKPHGLICVSIPTCKDICLEYSIINFSNIISFISEIIEQKQAEKRTKKRIHKQNKYSEIRTKMWKISAKQDIKEIEFIKRICTELGNFLDITNINYHLAEDNNTIKCISEWHKNNTKSLLEIKTPFQVWKPYLNKEYTNITITNHITQKDKKILSYFEFKNSINNLVILPCKLNYELHGFLILISNSNNTKWLKADISLFVEIMQILSQTINKIRIKEKIKNNETRYKNIFNNIQDVYYETNLEGTILEVSPSISNISKYKREELIGKSINDIYYNIEERNKLLDNLLKNKIVTDYEINLIDKNNSVVTCSITTKISEADKDKEQKIIGTLRNVQQRKRAELELKKIHQELEKRVAERTEQLAELNNKLHLQLNEKKYIEMALRQSEERYKEIVEDQTEFICRYDTNFKITFVNNAYCKYLNLVKENIIGHSLFNLFDPDQHTIINKTIKKLNWKKKIITIEIKIFHEDDKIVWQQWRQRAIFDENKSVIGYQGVGRDITDLKNTEEELRRAKDKLEKQNNELKKIDKIKDNLIRDVSHELKSPVAKLNMQLELLKNSLLKNNHYNNYKKMVNIMDSTILRQNKVIKNILDLSRLESGGRKYQKQKVNIKKLIEDVLEDYRFNLEINNFKINMDVKNFIIYSDKEMLFHVFSNIVNNSIKYINPDNDNILDIYDNKNNDKLTITIKDNGIGICPDNINKVFDKFYQVSASSDGSGVGLSITKQIIKDMGGKISIESKGINKGTSINIELPLNRK